MTSERHGPAGSPPSSPYDEDGEYHFLEADMMCGDMSAMLRLARRLLKEEGPAVFAVIDRRIAEYVAEDDLAGARKWQRVSERVIELRSYAPVHKPKTPGARSNRRSR